MEQQWIKVEDRSPEIPKGEYGVSVLCCWYCCFEEPKVVSEVIFSKSGEFQQLVYGTQGCQWMKVDANYWMPLPQPPGD